MPDLEYRRVRFEALFREHYPAVRAFARRRVPSEAVDDIVSETFLIVWRRLESVPDPPLPWLLAVTRNVLGTQLRGATRRHRLWVKVQAAHVEGQVPWERELDHGRVGAALSRLSEKDREALTLVGWDGLTPAEAAAVLGQPPDRFRQRLHRAGLRLKAQLAADHAPEEPAPPRHDPVSEGAPT
jgi:RNA polymerase sigma-70 factor (ECF subfamily)